MKVEETTSHSPSSKLIKVDEVAERLACSKTFVYMLVQRRRIPHVRLGEGNGGIRFLSDDVDAYLYSVRVGASTRDPAIARPRPLKHLRLGTRRDSQA